MHISSLDAGSFMTPPGLIKYEKLGDHLKRRLNIETIEYVVNDSAKHGILGLLCCNYAGYLKTPGIFFGLFLYANLKKNI
jgi:hypothetical protein